MEKLEKIFPKAQAVDVCVSFDTTGSMYPCLTQVRRVTVALVDELFKRVPNIRIGIIAHGDYCDAGRTYVYKGLDFTGDQKAINNFVNNVGATDGGDCPECYELVLHEASKLTWRDESSRALVLIGDDVPHTPNYDMNTLHLDWRKELANLKKMAVNVYGVHAMPGIRRHSKSFYEELASSTGGFYITLDQFNEINDLLIGICTNQSSKETLEGFISSRKSGIFSMNVRRNLDRMLGRDTMAYDKATHPGAFRAAGISAGLNPVPSGRFQVIRVDADADIRGFVQEQGIEFKKGRGFYELTKAVKVQQYKEIVLQDKRTGEFFNGSQVREMLGLAPQVDAGGVTESLHKKYFDDYKVFIQSTSVNRKLIGGTDLLYEVPDWDRAA